MITNSYAFQKALPIWECGSEKVINRSLVFTSKLGRENCTLAVAGASAFLVLVNGNFVAHGPARAGEGYYRVDEYALDEYLTESINTVEIRVFGYNANSFEYMDLPSFLCAEIIREDDEVLAYTSSEKTGFLCYPFDERMIRVQRYSYQRLFVENYRLNEQYLDYACREELEVAVTEPKQFICRDIPYGEYIRLPIQKLMGKGVATYSHNEDFYVGEEITLVGSNGYKGYTRDELDYFSNEIVGQMKFSGMIESTDSCGDIHLTPDSYAIADMGKNHVGLFEFELEVLRDAEFFVLFDELLIEDDVNWSRMEASNILTCIAKAGTYKIVTAEPYGLRYVKLICKNGEVKVHNFQLIEVAFPQSLIKARFVSNDKVMKKIYDAAVLTFRNNTTDIYMDCPSRERAGWLCDSFFISRVEHLLTGASRVEKQFLANFLMADSYANIPNGMLPMCYPATQHYDLYIPNWAMWYGIELFEYYNRTGDSEFVNCAKTKMYELCNYFEQYENEFGLLENLSSWVFVEWSKANSLVQDVSFASNMVYAKMLECLGILYCDEKLKEKAVSIRETINTMAMTESGFYCDNAYRKDGKLILSGERTETCQYYAFYFDCATPESHTWLWNTMVRDFGYDRKETGAYPEIYASNAFIGNFLRLDLLDRYGFKDTLYDNIKGYFEYMADITGTLWEHIDTHASCNHGFASHVVYWMKSMGLVVMD